MTEQTIRDDAVDAAWAQFQKMPSSNPSDYAHAILSSPVIRRIQEDAWLRAHECPYIRDEDHENFCGNPYRDTPNV